MKRRNQFRLVICDLVLRLPLAKPSGPGAMQSQPSTFCIFFKNRSCKVFHIPTFFSNGHEPAALLNKPTAVFDLSDAEMSRLSKSKKPLHLIFELHCRSNDGLVCGFSTDRVLGTVKLPLDFNRVRRNHETQFHGGWLDLDKKARKENRLGVSYPQLHVSVQVEPDTRHSFKFMGSPKGNVEIYYKEGPIRQPVFRSTFTWGPGPEANLVQPDKPTKGLNSWLLQQLCLGEKRVELRSGWSVTICNTSGSPVAVASMLVPYVPKMQPLAWLIEQFGEDGWVPWGRLAAWHAAADTCIHIRFEKATCAREVEWLVNPNQGGTLSIDYQSSRRGGFVFSASVGREGSRSLLTVEVSAKHIKCVEDAASSLALAGGSNLSLILSQQNSAASSSTLAAAFVSTHSRPPWPHTKTKNKGSSVSFPPSPRQFPQPRANLPPSTGPNDFAIRPNTNQNRVPNTNGPQNAQNQNRQYTPCQICKRSGHSRWREDANYRPHSGNYQGYVSAQPTTVTYSQRNKGVSFSSPLKQQIQPSPVRPKINLVVLLVLLLFCVSNSGEAALFEVGRSNGSLWTWAIPSNQDFYRSWASGTKFTVGDTIHFRYKHDSVFVVSQNDFETCNLSRPMITYYGKNTYYMFGLPGTYYFISGELGHCELGQKLAIQVTSSTTLDSPAPVPSSDMSIVGGSTVQNKSSSSGSRKITIITFVCVVFFIGVIAAACRVARARHSHGFRHLKKTEMIEVV